MRLCVHVPRCCMFLHVGVDVCCVYQCVYCSYIVQISYADGSTLLGNYEDSNMVGQHVYMERGMFVYDVDVPAFVSAFLCALYLRLCVFVCSCLCMFLRLCESCLCVSVCACVYVRVFMHQMVLGRRYGFMTRGRRSIPSQVG